MRIVIDLQAAQSESRFRGIGRYSLSFAKAVAENRGKHEVIIALSGLLPDAIEEIRYQFSDLLPSQNIRVWHAPGPVAEGIESNDIRRRRAEVLRESFLKSLNPSVIHVCSLFEGHVDDAVTSIGVFDGETPVTVTLYDLIPLLNESDYLTPHPNYEIYYRKKIQHLQQSQLCLAISESASKEVTGSNDLDNLKTVNVSSAIEECFRPIKVEKSLANDLLERLGIETSFILYSGGLEPRKNLNRMLQAYVRLPVDMRSSNQLVFVGKLSEEETKLVLKQAADAGLTQHELCITGYVSNEDLVALFNLCRLFVFPSLHEGFGLPVLEAMACGAAVICSNTTSLPEVVGFTDAMFDPFDVTAIGEKMEKALRSRTFRDRLIQNGVKRAELFSWGRTATLALGAWEDLVDIRLDYEPPLLNADSQDRILDNLGGSLLPIESNELRSIATAIAQNELTGTRRRIFVDVSELCQRDAATGVQRVVKSYLREMLQNPPHSYSIVPVCAVENTEYLYARGFHLKMLGLPSSEIQNQPIRWQRGDVFFGLDMQHHIQLNHSKFYQQLRRDGVVVKFLVHDLLPIELPDLFASHNLRDQHQKWLRMIAETDGAICVSQSTQIDLQNWLEKQNIKTSSTFQNAWVHNGASLNSKSLVETELPAAAISTLSIIRDRPTFLCVGTLEPRKCQMQILEACELLWRQSVDCNLVFVGNSGWGTEELVDRLLHHPESQKRLFWLSGIDDIYLRAVYRSATALICASINEGFGLPLIEAAEHGTCLIARDIPVFREVAGEHAFYFTGYKPIDLANAICIWLGKYERKEHPTTQKMKWSTWKQAAEKLKKALVGQHCPRRQMLVDISELVRHDAGTGIQRVVGNILGEWLKNPPKDYRIEPVYAESDGCYRYAKVFGSKYLDCGQEVLTDEPVIATVGDFFLGLDLQPTIVSRHRDYYTFLREQGVTVKFVVYDLLPISLSQYFPSGAGASFSEWLQIVASNHGAICISESVAKELEHEVAEHRLAVSDGFDIDWFHLGADYQKEIGEEESLALSQRSAWLAPLKNRTLFLMVGTIEPRKGHAQVIAAFTELWAEGADVALMIVGKRGWSVDALIDSMESNQNYNESLFWLQDATDLELESMYLAADCLIAASEGEGFGLPLIEAAQHGVPIIARDIPVFREITGDNAFYFASIMERELSQALLEWLEMYNEGTHPRSEPIKWLSWRESAIELMGCVAKVDKCIGVENA
ncbi:MAG: glycosyltransferase family 1 protein [Hyphomicrobiales bacterium]